MTERATLTERAGELNRAGRFAEAAAAASAALARDPGDARAMLELAVSNASLAIADDPTQADAYAVRASAYVDLELYDLVLSDLRQAADRDARYGPILRKYEDAAARAGEDAARAEGDATRSSETSRASRSTRVSLLFAAGFAFAGLGLAGFAGRGFLRKSFSELARRFAARRVPRPQAEPGPATALAAVAVSAAAACPAPARTAPADRDAAAIPAPRTGAAHEDAQTGPPGSAADDARRAQPWSTGLVIGQKYRLIEVLYTGARGPAWLAEDGAGGRWVVLKRATPQAAEDRPALLGRARRLAAFDHPGIVKILDVVDEGADPLLAYEWVPGQSLDRVIPQVRKLDFAEARWILQSVCGGLGYAHAQGMLHLNLKPSNVLIPLEGPAKLTDFWAATEPPRPVDERFAGAPELQSGHAGPPADVFALGACLRDMLSGAEWANPHIQQVAAKAMSRRPEGRYQSAAEFYSALELIAV